MLFDQIPNKEVNEQNEKIDRLEKMILALSEKLEKQQATPRNEVF